MSASATSGAQRCAEFSKQPYPHSQISQPYPHSKFHNQATPDRQEPGHTDNGTRTQAHQASNGTGTGSHTPLTTQDPNPQTATQPAAVRPTLAGAAWKAKKS